MTFSLTHFLDFNLFLLLLFPWAKAFYSTKKVTKASFSSSFISTVIFIVIYVSFTKLSSFLNYFKGFTFLEFGIALLVAFLCLFFDFLIYKIVYKKIVYFKIDNNSIGMLFLLLFMLPFLEEFIYRACLYSFYSVYSSNPIIYIILSSISFGLNHMVYPKINVVTKSIWGIFLSILFILFENIWLCVIVHIICNLFIYIAGSRAK